MKTILFLSSNERPSTCAKVAGVRRYAKSAGWSVQVVEMPKGGRDLAALAAFWKADGCVVECGGLPPPSRKWTPRIGKATPAVYLDPNPKHMDKGASFVSHDSAADGLLAARELIAIGCECFAYLAPPGNCFWSREREAAFIRGLRLNGKRRIFRFRPAPGTGGELRYLAELKPFIRSLPAHCGVFAANDLFATKAVALCKTLRRKVPEEIAVLGVDNVEKDCLAASPPLSSIAPDFECGGFLASEMLDRVMRRPSARRLTATFKPLTLVRRSSTTRHAAHSATVVRALALVTAHGGALKASDVFAKAKGSRRAAESAFRQATGKSVLQHIAQVRTESACSLLLQTHVPLSTIPERIGYRSQAAFSRFFLRQTGLTPSAWRRRNATSPGRGGKRS